MKSIISFTIALLIASFSYGQYSINEALAEIETNNPTIMALQAQAQSAKAEGRVGLAPPNPEFELGRFPAMDGAGIKSAWGVSQHFEFPTVYSKRMQLVKSNDLLVDNSYNSLRQSTLLDAKMIILELIHNRRVLAEYKQREAFAKSMLQVVQKKVDAGQSSVIDLNNARLRVAEAIQNQREIENSIYILKQKIRVYNGGKDINLSDTTLILVDLANESELTNRFISLDPRFKLFEQMVDNAEKQKSLAVHQGLPDLTIGYESEKTSAEHFVGFRAGISIPLWGNTGNRRAATSKLSASRVEYQSQKQLLELEYKEFFLKAQNTKLRLDELKQAHASFSNIALLKKAVELGQISVIDFFNEVTFLYGITDRIFELEIEYAILNAHLHRFEL